MEIYNGCRKLRPMENICELMSRNRRKQSSLKLDGNEVCLFKKYIKRFRSFRYTIKFWIFLCELTEICLSTPVKKFLLTYDFIYNESHKKLQTLSIISFVTFTAAVHSID